MSPWFKDLAVEQRLRRACELAATTKGIANHLRFQQDLVTADGLQMDFTGRFEHLEEDFGYVCRALGIEAALPHLNRSQHRPYQEFYDEETRALAAATYRRDVDAFQYSFEDALAEGEDTYEQAFQQMMDDPAVIGFLQHCGATLVRPTDQEQR